MHNYSKDQYLDHTFLTKLNQTLNDPRDHIRPAQNYVRPQIALSPSAISLQPYWITVAAPERPFSSHQAHWHQRQGCFQPLRLDGSPIPDHQVHTQPLESIVAFPIQPICPELVVDTKAQNASRLKRLQECTVCGRAYKHVHRHMRTHDAVSRFNCVYPRQSCPHKRGSFLRRYQFREHLLQDHFSFEDPCATQYSGIGGKLSFIGKCFCGREMTARDFLENHIMMKDEEGQFTCPDLRVKWGVPLTVLETVESF